MSEVYELIMPDVPKVGQLIIVGDYWHRVFAWKKFSTGNGDLKWLTNRVGRVGTKDELLPIEK